MNMNLDYEGDEKSSDESSWENFRVNGWILSYCLQILWKSRRLRQTPTACRCRKTDAGISRVGCRHQRVPMPRNFDVDIPHVCVGCRHRFQASASSWGLPLRPTAFNYQPVTHQCHHNHNRLGDETEYVTVPINHHLYFTGRLDKYELRYYTQSTFVLIEFGVHNYWFTVHMLRTFHQVRIPSFRLLSPRYQPTCVTLYDSHSEQFRISKFHFQLARLLCTGQHRRHLGESAEDKTEMRNFFSIPPCPHIPNVGIKKIQKTTWIASEVLGTTKTCEPQSYIKGGRELGS